MVRVKGFGGKTHNVRPYGDNLSGNDLDCCDGLIIVVVGYCLFMLLIAGIMSLLGM